MSLSFTRSALAMAAALTIGGCATYDGYGGGGYANYGGVYNDPYYGWYDNFYYPGSGYYIYDRGGTRYRWNDSHRRYWEGRRGNRRGSDNWSGYPNQRPPVWREDNRNNRPDRDRPGNNRPGWQGGDRGGRGDGNVRGDRPGGDRPRVERPGAETPRGQRPGRDGVRNERPREQARPARPEVRQEAPRNNQPVWRGQNQGENRGRSTGGRRDRSDNR